MWITEDGLGKLDLDDERPPFSGKFKTTKNANGILFRVILDRLQMLAGRTEWKGLDIVATILLLESYDHPGLYNRHCGHEQLEAHDNYAAIAATSVHWGTRFAGDIIACGNDYGFCFNNLEPGKYDIRAQRQGGEIAFYKFCAGKIPLPWEFAWLGIGLLIAITKGGPSEAQLSWLRVDACNASMKKYSFPVWLQNSWDMVSMLWHLGLKLKHGKMVDVFKKYYRPEHPIIALAQEAGL